MNQNKNIEDVIQKVYLEPINVDGISDDFAQRLTFQDKAANEIMKVYEKTLGTDFQQYLKDKLVPMAGEKLQRDISEEVKKEQVLKQEKEAVNKVKNTGAAVDAKVIEEAEQNAEKTAGDTSQIDLQSELMKAVYMSALEEYHHLRMSLYEGKNGQVRTGDMTPGYKMGAKLVIYQNYLRKLDMGYRARNGCFIAQDDDEIKAKEAHFAKQEAKDQKLVNKKATGHLEKVDELNSRIEYLAKKMVELSSMASIMDTDSFESRMDTLQSEYIAKVAQLEEMSPSILELKKQVKDVEKQEEFETRKLGTQYSKKHDKAVGDAKAMTSENANDKKLEQVQERIEDSTNDLEDANARSAEKLIENFEEGVSKDGVSVEELSQMVESAEGLTGVSTSVSEVSKEPTSPNNDGTTDPAIRIPEILDTDSPVAKECKKAVESPEEVTKKDVKSLQERADRVKETINRDVGEKQR